MAEINNNIPNFGHKVEKVNKTGVKPQKKNTEILEDKKLEYTVDTGVLGRSQVTPTDITPSVKKAVMLAENQSIILPLSDIVFNTVYEENLEAGKSKKDAYIIAALAVEEVSKFCSDDLRELIKY